VSLSVLYATWRCSAQYVILQNHSPSLPHQLHRPSHHLIRPPTAWPDPPRLIARRSHADLGRAVHGDRHLEVGHLLVEQGAGAQPPCGVEVDVGAQRLAGGLVDDRLGDDRQFGTGGWYRRLELALPPTLFKQLLQSFSTFFEIFARRPIEWLPTQIIEK
jgi:hypothetical protein